MSTRRTGAVLVTGGAGYIGSHVVHALLKAGETPVVLDNLSTGSMEAVPRGVAFHLADAGDRQAVESVLAQYRVCDVMHFAGSLSVPESVADPVRYYENNLATSLRLIQSCLAAGAQRFVFSSTAAVYREPEHGKVREGDRVEPGTPYGRTKLAVEWILADVARARGLRHVALRYFNVAGADPKGRAGPSEHGVPGLFQRVARSVLAGMPLPIYGDDFPTRDGTGVRDYIHVSDLAEAHIAALRHLRKGGESLTLNCGYGRGHSVRDVVAAFEAVCGHSISVAMRPRRPGDLAEVVADAAEIRGTLGWRPRFDDIELMARTTLDWERARAKAPAAAAPARNAETVAG